MIPHGYSIERAGSDDLLHLPRIEREAGVLFAGLGIADSVLSDETSLEELQYAQERGLLWVARAQNNEVVGFALLEVIDDQLHLEEIDVHPAHGRRGIGRALIEAVCAWGSSAGYHYVTLTTFRNIAWNEAFYAHAGFRSLSASELTPALADIVRDEASRGLDPARRVVMRRDLS